MPGLSREQLDAAPYFEEVAEKSGKKFSDYMIGRERMSEELGISAHRVDGAIARGELKAVLVKNFQGTASWVALKTDVDAYKKWAAEQEAERVAVMDRDKAEKLAATELALSRVVLPAEANPVPHQNGNPEIPGAGVIILKNGVPILSVHDAEVITHALFDQRAATQTLTRTVDANTQALKENTAALQKMREAWEK